MMAAAKRRSPTDEGDAAAGPDIAGGPGSAAPTLPIGLPALSTAHGARKPDSLLGQSGEADAYYRHIYDGEPDFRQLSRQDAAFASFLKPNGQLDFTDPSAVMQLTKTLLRLDFGLDIELLEERLCPPVPNRHSYILWLKELLDSTSYDAPGGKLSGIDIGTGASCIYPLLGCAQRPWYFVATDVDEKSLACARRNVQINGFENRIRVIARRPEQRLVPVDDLSIDSVDFIMTNPPFYVSQEELEASAKKKSRPPFSACTGAPVEMVCDGGEVGFVGCLIEESLELRDRVRWYTSLLGKASSLETLVDRLRDSGIDNFAVTEIVQGNKTRRWALGWSFGPMRPSQPVARGMKAVAWRKILPAITEVELFQVPIGHVGQTAARADEFMMSLDLISWEWDKEKLRGVGRARENVWSRAYRRRKMREQTQPSDGGRPDEEGKPKGETAFGFLISIHANRSETTVSCRWLEGHVQAVFESFCGFLKGRLSDSK